VRRCATYSIVLTLLLCILPSFPDAGERGIFIGEDVQLRVADVFMEEEEYYRAITEYKRFLILFPDSERADYALLQIGIAYYRGEEFESAARALGTLREKHPGSAYVSKSLYLEGMTYWKAKRYPEAKAVLETVIVVHPESDYAACALAVKSLVYLDSEDIESSRYELRRFLELHPFHARAPEVREAIVLLDHYERLPRKSPTFAAVLSAIVPGSGYVYAGHVGDGITAFFLNALFIAGTITGIHQENYAVAGIAGVVGLPFYVGNIYGSANAARKWNLAERQELRRTISHTLSFAQM
jgi:outer membrane protein assembly factor BamD (BamD/ComL family)/TM2 domain-containing membrane protein YozV